MSGVNHNMNHIVKRVETRVLAPPGGFSSVSFGSAEAHNYRNHNFNPKARAQESQESHRQDFPSESLGGYLGMQKENSACTNHRTTQRRDHDKLSAASHGSSSISSLYQPAKETRSQKEDYAEQLRLQIALKKQMHRDEEDEHHNRRHREADKYHEKRQNYLEGGSSNVVSHKRKSMESYGSRSSFSLAWDH